MKHVLPSLPYDHAALEPHIDAPTMALAGGAVSAELENEAGLAVATVVTTA